VTLHGVVSPGGAYLGEVEVLRLEASRVEASGSRGFQG